MNGHHQPFLALKQVKSCGFGQIVFDICYLCQVYRVAGRASNREIFDVFGSFQASCRRR